MMKRYRPAASSHPSRLYISALLLLATILLAWPSGTAGADGRPNILFFLTDDQRHDMLGCAGHPVLFDGEDFGDFNTMTDVLIGSKRYASLISGRRQSMGILLDMVGDANARFPYEGYSWNRARDQVQLLWNTAASLGYGVEFDDYMFGSIQLEDLIVRFPHVASKYVCDTGALGALGTQPLAY